MNYRMFDHLVLNASFFDPNAVSVVGERRQLLGGRRALLVTDKDLWAAKGSAVDRAPHYPRKAGIGVAISDGVGPDPKDANVHDGLAVLRREQCSIIVIVGGGSPHDHDKGIGIAATHEGDLYQYVGIETLTNPLPPVVVVNTTVGTASKAIRHYVLTDTQTKARFVVVSQRDLPSASINDPLLMIGKLAALTAAIRMDALTHAIEAYIFEDADPVTDAATMQAIRLIARNLRQATTLGSNLQTRENMAHASPLAGMAFSNANLGCVHAMVYQLDGLYDMPYGVTDTVLLPYMVRYNLIASLEKFVDIAELMGENITGLSTLDTTEKAIVVVTHLSVDIGIPQRLRDLGVKEVDSSHMAEVALKNSNTFLSPRGDSGQEIAVIFRQAF